MSKKWLVLVMTLIVLLVTMPLLAACDDDDDEEETKTVQPTKTAQPTETAAPTETQAPRKEGEITVGWLASFTGVAATQRDYSIDLAVKEINEAGGVQVGDTIYTFDLAIEGDQLTAAGAVSGIQKLLYEKDIVLVNWGAVTPPQSVRPFTQAEKVLFIDDSSAEDWISPEHPYSFYIGSDGAVKDLIVLDWVSKNRPDIKTVVGIKQLSSAAEDMAEVHQKLVPAEYGIEFTGYEFFDRTTRDFYPVLTSALQGDPDAIILESNMGMMVVRQARDLGFEGTFIVAGDLPEHWVMITPEEMDGIISLAPPEDSPQVLQAYKDYLDAYAEMRSGGVPYSYETTFMGFYIPTLIYVSAIKAVGSTDPDKVVEAMKTQTLTLEFPGGEKLDVRFFGQEQFGSNSYLIPTPEYLSVNRMDKPELMEVIEQDKLYEYRALYDMYRLAE